VRVERHETEHGSWEVVRRPAAAALQPYLGGPLEGWSQAGTAENRLREVPFPGLPLILNLGAPWRIDGPSKSGPEQHDSFVAGLHTAPTLVDGAPEASCIELRLTALGARRLLQVPMHEVVNRTVPLEELLPAAHELTGRLRETRSWEQRFELVELALARRLADSVAPTPGVAWSWQLLLRTGGRIPIRVLADELGWSPRRLIARFREQIGLAPKTAARVIRFDRVASALRRPQAPGLTELALECGYFDQAHLNREFRELAATTPTAFKAARLASGGIAA
jgi:AraC-like DNA-binding protein